MFFSGLRISYLIAATVATKEDSGTQLSVAGLPHHPEERMRSLGTLLQREFERRQERNPKYSLRAFARSLRIDAATLSQILKGKRALSLEKAKELLECLDLADTERNAILLALLHNEHLPVVEEQDLTYLDHIQDELLGSWLCYAILSLFETSDFVSDPGWVARRLGAPAPEVARVLDLLEEIGLIDRQADPWVFRNVSLSTRRGTGGAAILKVHEDCIRMSIDAMRTVPTELRDISGMTLAIPRSKLPEAARRIQEFRRSLARFLSEGELDEVYRLNIQLFPLTRRDDSLG